MKTKFNTRRVTFLGMCTAVAMLLSYVEFLLPPIWSAVPGIKIGLANIIIVYLFFKSGRARVFDKTFSVGVAFWKLFNASLQFCGSASQLSRYAAFEKDKFVQRGGSQHWRRSIP